MDDSDLNERLRRLAEQHRAGALSDSDYAAAKSAVLGGPSSEFAQETLALPAVGISVPSATAPSSTSRGGLGLMVLAVGVVVLVLVAIVWFWPR